jgi:hypothetical protein
MRKQPRTNVAPESSTLVKCCARSIHAHFGVHVKGVSVKNFQLCERNAQDHIMQFGRIEGRHALAMEFHYPWTPMQAFVIAISSLQSKISFG